MNAKIAVTFAVLIVGSGLAYGVANMFAPAPYHPSACAVITDKDGGVVFASCGDRVKPSVTRCDDPGVYRHLRDLSLSPQAEGQCPK